MDVDVIHKLLLAIFPQVDSRVLRAVAFAHANDADSAVEAVLNEVIPNLPEDIIKSSSPNVSGSPSKEAVDATATDQPNSTSLLESVHESLKDTDKDENSRFTYYSISSEESEDEEATSLRKGKSKARSDVSLLSPPFLVQKKNGARAILSDREDSDEPLLSVNEAIREEQSREDGFPLETSPQEGKSKTRNNELPPSYSMENKEFDDCTTMLDLIEKGKSKASSNELPPSYSMENRDFDDGTTLLDLVDSDIKSLLSDGAIYEEQLCDNGLPTGTNSAVVDEASTIITSSKNDSSTCEMIDLQDESAVNMMASRSGYVCSTDFLEELIEEARNNKQVLVSTMDSVISLAREVELQEKAAEEAKVEANSGCEAIQNKVQELKLALQRAKEANDMHAGEVYAEKAVLTTEAKELQSRLLSLSDERDRSLRILDEMRESLEIRLNAAQKEIEEALQVKLEKEASAREELTFQEMIMDDVVQESKLLKQEAEANSKLQDFLMDRGRIVDILQGEISVKCQDVKLLKEKFDNRVPLSTSLFSNQTILGSSWSSSESMSPPHHVPIRTVLSSWSSSSSMSPPRNIPKLVDSDDKLQKSEVFVDSFDTLQSNTEQDSHQILEQGPHVADSSEAMKSSLTTPNEHLSNEEEKVSDDGWDLV